MTKSNENRVTTALAGALGMFMLAGLAAPAAAQEAVANENADKAVAEEPIANEIIVTARMREERLLDAPLTVTTFGERAILDAGIKSVGDFIPMVPNVVVNVSQNAGSSFLIIRGISQVRNGESPVATVVDGVIQVSPNQFTQPMFDLQSIEVVKGPQGAIYGRNATGGAIIINTKQPTNDFEGHVQGGFGKASEYGVEGVISGPIVPDKLLFRVGGRFSDRDGYYQNPISGRDMDKFRDWTVRGRLLFTPTDNFTADLRYNHEKTTGGAVNFVIQATVVDPTTGRFAGFDFFKPNGASNDPNRVGLNTANNIGENDRTLDEASLKLDWKTDEFTLTAITSYNVTREYIMSSAAPYTADTWATVLGTDAAGALAILPSIPLATKQGTAIANIQTQWLDVEAWSQEVRLASAQDRKFRWLVGAYYLETDRFVATSNCADVGLGSPRITRSPDFNSQICPTLSYFGDDNQNTAWAVFGQANYDVSDQIEASFAIRYDKDKRVDRVSPDVQGSVASPPLPIPGEVKRKTFSQAQPKFTLRYKPSDDLTVFGTWGIGFRSGGFNQSGTGVSAGLSPSLDQYPAEKTESFEVGFKSKLLNNRLTFNAAAFTTILDNMQYFLFVPATTAQILVPIEKSRLSGFELEASLHAADGLDLFSSFGYTHTKINAYALNPAVAGNWVPYVPRTTFNVGGQYRYPVTDSVALFGRVDYQLRGKEYGDPGNSAPRNSVGLLNFRLGAEDADRTWALTGWVRNATNKKYNAEALPLDFGGAISTLAHIAPPRTWGVELRYNF